MSDQTTLSPFSAVVEDAQLPAGADPRSGRTLAVRVGKALAGSRLPIVQMLVLLLVFAWAGARLEGFTSLPSLRATLVIAALLALAALGQTLVVLIGGLDMAVPGYMTVGAVGAVVLPSNHGWSLWSVALFVIAVTAVAGGTIGATCHILKVQPLVVSLGVSAMLTGGTLIATKGNFMGSPPAPLTELTSTMSSTFGLPVPPVLSIAIVALVAVSVVLARTVIGRQLYATGANPVAAAGIQTRTGWIWTGTFAVSAAFTGLAGMLVAGFSSGATLAIGEPYFFSGLAAVLVGGTALGSAQGDFTRTVIGALTLTILSTILAGMGMDDGGRRMLFGILIVVVILLYGRERRLRDRL
jgi:ribose transport system permease protein